MEFITARDLRINTGEIWKMLTDKRELVVTLNGRPVALLTGISGETLEPTLAAIRRSRGEWAIRKMQEAAVKKGLDRLTDREIEAEIRAVRKERSR